MELLHAEKKTKTYEDEDESEIEKELNDIEVCNKQEAKENAGKDMDIHNIQEMKDKRDDSEFNKMEVKICDKQDTKEDVKENKREETEEKKLEEEYEDDFEDISEDESQSDKDLTTTESSTTSSNSNSTITSFSEVIDETETSVAEIQQETSLDKDLPVTVDNDTNLSEVTTKNVELQQETSLAKKDSIPNIVYVDEPAEASKITDIDLQQETSLALASKNTIPIKDTILVTVVEPGIDNAVKPVDKINNLIEKSLLKWIEKDILLATYNLGQNNSLGKNFAAAKNSLELTDNQAKDNLVQKNVTSIIGDQIVNSHVVGEHVAELSATKDALEDKKEETEEKKLKEEYEDDSEDISKSDEDSTTTESSTTSSETTSLSEVMEEIETSVAEVQQETSLAKNTIPVKNPIFIAAVEPRIDDAVTPLSKFNNFIGQDNKLIEKETHFSTNILGQDKSMRRKFAAAKSSLELTSIVDDHVAEAPSATKAADSVTAKNNQTKKTALAEIDATPVSGTTAPKSIIDIFGKDDNSLKTTTTKSNLKLTSSYDDSGFSSLTNINNTNKKRVSFNDIVDGQIYRVDSTLMESNKEFLMALKPPQVSNGDVQTPVAEVPQKPQPYRKVYNAPVYHPIKLPPPTPRTPAELPQLKNVRKLPPMGQVKSKEKKITAADIFGPSSKDSKVFDDICTNNDGEEDLLGDEDLDDAIDFLLNM